jgi:phosphoribosylformylglycinamidine synthase
MKNDYKIGETKISIPPTVLFTAVAVLDDVNRVVSMDVKNPGDVVYVLGVTKHEMGGSEYLGLRGQLGATVPTVDFAAALQLYRALSAAMRQGLVASCHDCSDGGLAVALAESAFAGGYGMTVDISGLGVANPVVALFSESQSRFVVTVPADNAAAFEAALSGNPCTRLGKVIQNPVLTVTGKSGALVNAPLAKLKDAWQKPLRW